MSVSSGQTINASFSRDITAYRPKTWPDRWKDGAIVVGIPDTESRPLVPPAWSAFHACTGQRPPWSHVTAVMSEWVGNNTSLVGILAFHMSTAGVHSAILTGYSDQSLPVLVTLPPRWILQGLFMLEMKRFDWQLRRPHGDSLSSCWTARPRAAGCCRAENPHRLEDVNQLQLLYKRKI